MGRRMTSTDSDDLIEAERTVRHRLAQSDPPLDVDYEATAVVANVFRIASAARAHIQRTALAGDNLSFTAFTVLWVLWIWGEDEFRHVARAPFARGGFRQAPAQLRPAARDGGCHAGRDGPDGAAVPQGERPGDTDRWPPVR